MSTFSKISYYYFLYSPLKTFKMMCDLLESGLSYTRLKSIESEKSVLRKIELKFSERFKVKSPSNVDYLPPVHFLIIITTILVSTI